MKCEWGQRFAELIRRHQGDLTQEEHARRLGLSRQTYQRIILGQVSLKYEYVEIALRRLGLCHCEVAGLPCPHRPNGSRP